MSSPCASNRPALVLIGAADGGQECAQTGPTSRPGIKLWLRLTVAVLSISAFRFGSGAGRDSIPLARGKSLHVKEQPSGVPIMENEANAKLQLEIEKLSTEIRMLRRPWWQQAPYLAVIATIVGLAVAAYQKQAADFKQDSAESAAREKRLSEEKTELIRKAADLERQTAASIAMIQGQNQQLQLSQIELRAEAASWRQAAAERRLWQYREVDRAVAENIRKNFAAGYIKGSLESPKSQDSLLRIAEARTEHEKLDRVRKALDSILDEALKKAEDDRVARTDRALAALR